MTMTTAVGCRVFVGRRYREHEPPPFPQRTRRRRRDGAACIQAGRNSVFPAGPDLEIFIPFMRVTPREEARGISRDIIWESVQDAWSATP